VALAVLPYKTFDLDRFFVPKELVLHAAAALAALVLLARAPRLELTRVDTLLGAFLALSAVSALLATNRWVAWRALAVSLSGAALYWSARAVARAGWRDALLAVLSLGIWVAAVTALLQAYGVQSGFISINRAPGGTLGNRNFVAHLAAIGTPALLLSTLGARTRWGARVGGAAVVTLAAVLALSRSRAAWLALAAAAVIAIVAAVAAPRRWHGTVVAGRARWLVGASALGVLAAVLLPNTLNWKSDSPYLDSVRGVVNYREGSGHGRVLQYRNTVRLSSGHPVLGVGPGNWAVQYPTVASPNDPSLDTDDGMTANPWPSSDWMAFLSERGWTAFACLVLVFVGLGVGGLSALTVDAAPGDFAQGLALVTTVMAAAVVGAFDALLLLPAPALLVWGLFGALSTRARPRAVINLSSGRRLVAALLVLALGLGAVWRSASQAAAMALVERDGRVPALERAAALDPGSYRIQMRLAELDARRGRCDAVRLRAGRAHALFPAAAAPRRLLAACGGRVRAR
jgi:O-antigen ligase